MEEHEKSRMRDKRGSRVKGACLSAPSASLSSRHDLNISQTHRKEKVERGSSGGRVRADEWRRRHHERRSEDFALKDEEQLFIDNMGT